MIVSFHFSDDLSRCFLTIISCIYFIRFNNISDSSRLDSLLSFVWLQETSDHETLLVFHDDFLCMLLDDIAITHLPSDSLGGIYVFVMYVYINPTMPGMKKKTEIRMTRVKVEYAVCAYACTVACFLSIFRHLCLLSFACLPAHENI